MEREKSLSEYNWNLLGGEMIYTFNLMVELEPNGVDVAQAYRGQIFRKLGCPARFIFTQVPPRYKWDYYLSLGYAEDEIV